MVAVHREVSRPRWSRDVVSVTKVSLGMAKTKRSIAQTSMLPRLALLLASFLFALAAAEALTRSLELDNVRNLVDLRSLATVLEPSSYGAIRGVPGARIDLSTYEVRFNELGMRDLSLATKPEDNSRLLVLGDSVVFGLGIAWQDTLVPRLRAILGDGVEVVGAAIPGWSSVDQLAFLESQVDRIAPDSVVLVYVHNDIETENPMGAYFKAPINALANVNRMLLKHSHLFVLLSYTGILGRVGEYFESPSAASRDLREPEVFNRNAEPWQRSRAALGEMKTLLEGRGIELRIVGYTFENRALQHAMFAGLVEFGAETGATVVRANEPPPGLARADLVIDARTDGHPSAQGHLVLAQTVAALMRQ